MVEIKPIGKRKKFFKKFTSILKEHEENLSKPPIIIKNENEEKTKIKFNEI
jgi:hypothetical protein